MESHRKFATDFKKLPISDGIAQILIQTAYVFTKDKGYYQGASVNADTGR